MSHVVPIFENARRSLQICSPSAFAVKNTSKMTHLKQNKQTGALTTGAAAALLASCSWALPAVAADDAMTDLLSVLRQRGSITEAEYQRMKPHAEKEAAAASQTLTRDALKKDWFGKMSIRGYVQTRYTHVLEGVDNPSNVLHSPTEPNITERDTFFMRRARMIFSGDVHDHLYLYAQLDWQAGVATGYSETASSGLQTRDMYGDVSLDHDKEHRIRIGVSKVPYGFVNLQSSQNRLSIERPEALNSAVEGERDLGVYYMWADKTARARFRELIQLGLKGSGDYGVFTVGGYNGQGLNRYDSNRAPHAVARMAYPFKLDSGQFFELGLGGYQGKFVVGNSVLKSAPQFTDRRAAANFVWYPQPFGMEAEYTIGEGPETVIDYDGSGKGRGVFTTRNNTATTTAGRTTYSTTATIATPSRITTENLHGGYVLFNYKADTDIGTIIPFTRWSYFNGARKFVNNAPSQNVNEVDIGFEYQPWPSFEIALIYTRAFMRTNTGMSGGALTSTQTSTASQADAATKAANGVQTQYNSAAGYYNQVKDIDRVTLQLQYNF